MHPAMKTTCVGQACHWGGREAQWSLARCTVTGAHPISFQAHTEGEEAKKGAAHIGRKPNRWQAARALNGLLQPTGPRPSHGQNSPLEMQGIITNSHLKEEQWNTDRCRASLSCSVTAEASPFALWWLTAAIWWPWSSSSKETRRVMVPEHCQAAARASSHPPELTWCCLGRMQHSPG